MESTIHGAGAYQGPFIAEKTLFSMVHLPHHSIDVNIEDPELYLRTLSGSAAAGSAGSSVLSCSAHLARS